MTRKIELSFYVTVFILLWLTSFIGQSSDPMKDCQQAHSHDVCFTSIYK